MLSGTFGCICCFKRKLVKAIDCILNRIENFKQAICPGETSLWLCRQGYAGKFDIAIALHGLLQAVEQQTGRSPIQLTHR